jgi:hypothetical protein
MNRDSSPPPADKSDAHWGEWMDLQRDMEWRRLVLEMIEKQGKAIGEVSKDVSSLKVKVAWICGVISVVAAAVSIIVSVILHFT